MYTINKVCLLKFCDKSHIVKWLGKVEGTMKRIELLLIDDNKLLYEQLKSSTEDLFEVTYCDSQSCMRKEISDGKFKMLIMNFDLAATDAFTLYENLKRIYFGPIIFLTKIDDVKTRIQGLEKGADAFILLPCDFEELKLRIYKILLHLDATNSEVIGEYEIDYSHHRVYYKGKQLKFSPNPYRLLVYLLQNPNKDISREEILLKVWEYDTEHGIRIVDTNISLLRNLTLDGNIKSIRGIGYRYELDE